MLATIATEPSTDKTVREQQAWESYEKPTDQDLYPYLPDLYALTDQVSESEAGFPDLYQFIEVQSANRDCRQAFTSVRKPSST